MLCFVYSSNLNFKGYPEVKRSKIVEEQHQSHIISGQKQMLEAKGQESVQYNNRLPYLNNLGIFDHQRHLNPTSLNNSLMKNAADILSSNNYFDMENIISQFSLLFSIQYLNTVYWLSYMRMLTNTSVNQNLQNVLNLYGSNSVYPGVNQQPTTTTFKQEENSSRCPNKNDDKTL